MNKLLIFFLFFTLKTVGQSPNGETISSILSQGIFVDFEQTVYITDYIHHKIIKYLPNSPTPITIAGTGVGGNNANQLYFPIDIVLDKYKNLYTVDEINHRIQKWQYNANTSTTIATEGINYPSSPKGIFITQNGDLFVVDEHGHRVLKYEYGSSTPIVVAGGSFGSSNTQLKNPTSIFVDKSGNLFVSDTGNHRIQKYAPNSIFGLTVAGETGFSDNTSNRLHTPRGIHVDDDGNLFIADLVNDRIQKWTPNSTFGITVAGHLGRGTGPQNLFNPTDVHVDAEGNLYVSDTGNSRVQKYSVPCENTKNLTSDIIDSSKIIESSQNITSVSRISSNSKIILSSKSVTLSPGFSSEQGSFLLVKSDGCTQ